MAESQEKTKQPLVPMIGPDGSSALIDALEVHALMMRGAVPGVVMRAPDGRVGVVAFKNAEAAQNSGGTLLRNDGDPYPEGQTPVIVGHNGNGEPIWGTAPEPSVAGEMAKSFFANALDAFKGAAESFNPNPNAWEQKEGLTTPYDTVMRPLERLIEGNVQEYQTAQALVDQRKYAQAFLHDLAVPVPMLGPWIDGMLENYSQHLKEGDVAGAYGGLFGNIALAATMEGVPKVAAFARDVTRSIPGRVAEHIAPEETLTQPQGQEQLSPRERAAAARRMGVNLDLAQATDAGGPRMVKRINEHSATAGPGYEQARQGNAAALEAEAQRMVHGVRDRDTNPLGAPMGREEFGHTMQQAVKRHDAELRDAPGLAKQTQELLDQADKQDMTREEFGEAGQKALKQHQESLNAGVRSDLKDVTSNKAVTPTNSSLHETADNIYTANKQKYIDNPALLTVPGMWESWNWVREYSPEAARDPLIWERGKEPRAVSPESIRSRTARGAKDIDQAISLRSGLMRVAEDEDIVKSEGKGWLDRLVASVDNGITDPANERGLTPGQIQKFRAGMSKWKHMKSMYDDPQSPFYSIIRSREPATAADTLTKLKPTAVHQFREAMGHPDVGRPDLVGQQQRQAMQNLIDPTRNGEPDFAGLPARFRKLDKEQAAETFTPEQLDALGKIAAKADVETPYDKAGSQLKTLRDAPDAAAASNALFDSQGRSKLSQEEVRQLFEAAPEQMPHLQQQAVSRLLDPANNGTPDLAGLPTRWVRSNKDIAAHVMTPEQMRELDELSAVSRAAQYRSNPSGTAVSLQPAGEISGAVSGLTAGGSMAVMGHPVAGAITAAAAPAELAAQAVIGKAMRSPGLVEGVMEHEKPPTLREIWKNANQRRGLVSRAGDALRPGPDSGGGGAGGNGPAPPVLPVDSGSPPPVPSAPAVAPKIETAGNAALSPQQDATAAPPSLRQKFAQATEQRNAPQTHASEPEGGQKASLESVRKIVKDAGGDVELNEHGNVITLSKVVVPKNARGSGIGTRFMKELTNYADANGKTIGLTPSTDFGGSSKARLVDFYQRFGFKSNKGRSIDFRIRDTMRRDPVEVSKPQEAAGPSSQGNVARPEGNTQVASPPIQIPDTPLNPLATPGTGGTAPVDEITGLPLNEDGTVTLFHGTTKAGAKGIRASGHIQADAEPHVYLTTDQKGAGYGDGTVVPIKIDPSKLEIDDEFPNGRRDYRVSAGRPGGRVPVKVAPVPKEEISAQPSSGTATPVPSAPSLRDKFSQQVERRNAQGQAYGVSTPPETEPLIGAPPEPNEVHDPEKEAAVLAALTPRTPKAAPSAPVAAAKPAPAGVHPGTDGTTLRTGTSTSEQMAPQMAAPEGATHEVVHPETGQVVGHMVNGEYVPLENDEENAPSAQ